MHVAIVSPYSFARPGGVQEFSRGLARALRASGHDVSLFAPDVSKDTTGLDGVLTISLGRALGVKANGSVAPIGIDPRMLVRFDLALDAADVVHVQEPFQPASLAAAWRAPRSVPVVGTFHMAAERFGYYAAARPVLPRLVRMYATTTATSDASRDLVRRYVDVDPQLVPNGLDAAAYASAEPDAWMRSLGRTVLMLGRPEPRKGFATVLGAFPFFAAQRRDVHLVWVNTRADPDAVPSFVRDRVHYLGRVDDERKRSLFKAADVYCAPNLGGESFGMVVAEAMAAGRAIVASDLVGFRAAGGGAVEYVPPGDRWALAQAVGRLLDDDARRARLGTSAAERAAQFDWSVVAQRFVDIYRGAINRT